jgi:archaellum component FlaG (FlaF/FlaG flagellin family)
LPDQPADLIAAARAAAAWAHARRSTWTTTPLALLDVPAARRVSTAPDPIPSLPISPPPPPSVQPVAAQKAAPTGPSFATRAAEQVRDLAPPVLKWLPRVAAVAALSAGVLYGVRYAWQAVDDYKSRPPAKAAKPAATASGAPTASRKGTGGLSVTSTPSGAEVMVDGKPRGITPLTLSDLSVGKHTVELESDSGKIQRTITVAADKTTEMDESIFAGWLTVYSPFDLTITEGGRALSLDDRHQIMLAPGQHKLRLINRALAFDEVRDLDLKSGEQATLSVTPPPSTMTVTANEPGEVFLDGAKVGETGLNGLPVALGTHEIVVKRTAGGERRFTVTVTVKPFVLHVDF